VAQDLQSTSQFTQPMPSFLAAGLMCRVRILLSRMGAPFLTDWNTRSSGPSDFTARYLLVALPALTSTVSARKRSIRSIVRNEGVNVGDRV